MKLITSLLFTAFFCSNIYAQDFSAGLRTGISANADITNPELGIMTKSWDKEFFTRYTTKGRFAFEAGVNTYGYIYDPNDFYTLTFCGTVGDATTRRINTSTEYNMYDVSISAQYDISCNKMKAKCPMLNKLNSYIGVNIGNTFARTNTLSTYESVASGATSSDVSRSGFNSNPFIGLSHTLTYSFSKLYLVSTTSFTFRNHEFSGYFPNSSFSCRIGAGYNF